jgi:hypothetical protein
MTLTLYSQDQFKLFFHPISAFDVGWQPEILSPIARLPAELYYSMLFVQKMGAFRRLVLECFHKQKTTKITLNFPKIIEMHLNSSSQCIQLAVRQVNKREKNNYGKEKNSNSFALTLGSTSRPSAFALSVVPARHHALQGIYVNLLYIYGLFLASAIYDCVNTYTIVHVQGYSSSGAVSTL